MQGGNGDGDLETVGLAICRVSSVETPQRKKRGKLVLGHYLHLALSRLA